MIFRSSKPATREFRKWITAEVLPAIRKTGTYTLPGLPTLSDPEDAPAKRSTAELVEQINRRKVFHAGTHIQGELTDGIGFLIKYENARNQDIMKSERRKTVF